MRDYYYPDLEEANSVLEGLAMIWEPDYIAPLGAPEPEMEKRTSLSVAHMRNFRHYNQLPEDLAFVAPEAEAELIEEALKPGEQQLIDVIHTPGHENRWDEVEELKEHVEAGDNIHFFSSDYAVSQEKYIIEKELSFTSPTIFSVPTEDRLLKPLESMGRKGYRVLEYWSSRS